MGELAARDDAMVVASGGPADELLAAIGFLTRVPVGPRGASRSRTGASAFGLVGAGLGIVAALPLLAVGGAHPPLASIAAVGLLAALSGGLHLDGLADTFDALAAPAGAGERARTDPRAGSAGVVAIVIVLGLQAVALAELAGRGALLAAATLVAATAASRAAAPVWAVVVGGRFRPQGGLGAWFAEVTTGPAAAVGIVSTIIIIAALVELAGVLVGLATLVGSAAGSVLAAGLVGLRGQLDGDGYGTVIEVTAAAILLAAVVLG